LAEVVPSQCVGLLRQGILSEEFANRGSKTLEARLLQSKAVKFTNRRLRKKIQFEKNRFSKNGHQPYVFGISLCK
jgi:hypothetical protein